MLLFPFNVLRHILPLFYSLLFSNVHTYILVMSVLYSVSFFKDSNAFASWSGHDVPLTPQGIPFNFFITSFIFIPSTSLETPAVFPSASSNNFYWFYNITIYVKNHFSRTYAFWFVSVFQIIHLFLFCPYFIFYYKLGRISIKKIVIYMIKFILKSVGVAPLGDP